MKESEEKNRIWLIQRKLKWDNNIIRWEIESTKKII